MKKRNLIIAATLAAALTIESTGSIDNISNVNVIKKAYAVTSDEIELFPVTIRYNINEWEVYLEFFNNYRLSLIENGMSAEEAAIFITELKTEFNEKDGLTDKDLAAEWEEVRKNFYKEQAELVLAHTDADISKAKINTDEPVIEIELTSKQIEDLKSYVTSILTPEQAKKYSYKLSPSIIDSIENGMSKTLIEATMKYERYSVLRNAYEKELGTNNISKEQTEEILSTIYSIKANMKEQFIKNNPQLSVEETETEFNTYFSDFEKEAQNAYFSSVEKEILECYGENIAEVKLERLGKSAVLYAAPENIFKIADLENIDTINTIDEEIFEAEKVVSTVLLTTTTEAITTTTTTTTTTEQNVSKWASCGKNVSFNINYDEGIVTIKGTGEMSDYNEYASPLYFNSYIKKVIVEEGVTRIGSSFFAGRFNLEEVQISDTVTSIGKYAFKECGLKEIYIPKSVKSIEADAFIKNEDLVIKGYTNSAAQTYANKYNLKFEALDAGTIILGDIDDNGIIDASDASFVLGVYAAIQAGKEVNLTDEQLEAADVDGNDVINASDSSTILGYYSYTQTGNNIGFPDFISRKN